MSLFRSLPRFVSSSRCYFRSPLLTAVPRNFSTKVTLPPDIGFEELTKKLETKAITLIDVRPPDEIAEYGMIPNSKNLMIGLLGPFILKNEKTFQETHGFEKPSLDDPIVMTCLKGLRARTGQLAMLAVGYKDVRVYKGSFEDWLEKGGPVVFPEKEL